MFVFSVTHPCQYFLPFNDCIILHCVNKPHFVYSFINIVYSFS